MEMEVGSTESLSGLKFGRKIYFEDSSSSCSTGGPVVGPKKVRSSSVQAGQPPRCQVEGCKVDLSDAKAYYSRHKVCGMHSKSSQVIVAGLEQRFCQQCSRFHLLPEFDQGKRSCRRRLAGHNERRRKPVPGSLLPPPYGEASSGRVGSFVMDFSTYPRPGAAGGAPERTAGSHLPRPWQGCSNPEIAPPLPAPDRFMQTSVCGTSITAGHGIPPAVSDSSCALSLLSNQQPWAQRTRSPSGFVLHSEMNNMVGTGSCQNLPDLGLGQLSQPVLGHYPDERDSSHHQSRRLYLEPGLSTDFESSTQQHMNWSL